MENNLEELKEKVRDKLISGVFLNIHDCSLCGYPCGYLCRGNQLFYDSGCDCVNYIAIRPREWSDMDFLFEPGNGWNKKLTEFVNANTETTAPAESKISENGGETALCGMLDGGLGKL